MTTDYRKFAGLQIGGWRQFNTINLTFHERLTVITGINGAGKSTLMNILTRHLGASRPFLSIPYKSGNQNVFSNGLSFLRKVFAWANSDDEHKQFIGEITYAGPDERHKARIWINRNPGLAYDVSIDGQQPVNGFHMPSHRLLPSYQGIQPVPFGGSAPSSAFGRLIGHTYAGFRGEHTGTSVLTQLKQLIVDWATTGEGNSFSEPDLDQAKAYEELKEIFRKILPPEIGFRDFKIRVPDVLLDTDSGTFLIDAASGGLATLIEIAALIYTCSLQSHIKGAPFVVTFDEPENHLHPSLQRSLLPTLVNVFPQVQFIVATHSPFMVSSLRDSNVYVLRHAPSELEAPSAMPTGYSPAKQWVSSTLLDYVNRAGTAGEILRNVLGVPVTLPTWVETQLDQIVEKYDHRAIDEVTIRDLRNDVEAAGLKELFSEAVTRVGQRR